VEFVYEVASCGSFSLPSVCNVFADERKFRRRSFSFRTQQTRSLFIAYCAAGERGLPIALLLGVLSTLS
jgi:hypothetical protein